MFKGFLWCFGCFVWCIPPKDCVYTFWRKFFLVVNHALFLKRISSKNFYIFTFRKFGVWSSEEMTLFIMKVTLKLWNGKDIFSLPLVRTWFHTIGVIKMIITKPWHPWVLIKLKILKRTWTYEITQKQF